MIGEDKKIYLIDFGLAQRFRDPISRNHISFTTGLNLVGTIRYASINAHLGHQQSRRDDLESLAYTLLYSIHGTLAWQGMTLHNKGDRCGAVLHRKRDVSNYIGPAALVTFLHYTRALTFEEAPDYVYLHSLFQNLSEPV